MSAGRNYAYDPNNPSVLSDGAKADCSFYYYYRNGSGGFVTDITKTEINPTGWDDGTGTLPTAPNGKYTIQRIFFYPKTPDILGVYYGRATYVSIAEAAANLNIEEFSEIENTRTNAIFLGYLIVKAGASSLQNTADALILQSGTFRSTTSGGGSVAINLDDLTDVTISNIQDNDLIIYDSATQQWSNSPASHLSVTSYNGQTGAVQGVSSFQGKTGAFGLSAGQGISFALVGNTYTFRIDFVKGAENIASASPSSGDNILYEKNDGTLRVTKIGTLLSTPYESGSLPATVTSITSRSLLLFDSADNSQKIITSTNATNEILSGAVTSFNGVTGAVQGVSSANGLTGAVTFHGGAGITVSNSGNGISFAMNYLQGGSTITATKYPSKSDWLVIQENSSPFTMQRTQVGNISYLLLGTQQTKGSSSFLRMVSNINSGAGTVDDEYISFANLADELVGIIDGGTFA